MLRIMRDTWMSAGILAVVIQLGSGCDSRKSAAPASGPPSAPSEGPPPAKVAEPAAPPGTDAGAPSDVAPAAAAQRPDPMKSLFQTVYTPGETLPDKLGRRIRFRLKDRSVAPIALHHIIDIPRPDGSREVFALYEYSVYEDCMAAWPDRKAGREHCLGESATVFDGENAPDVEVRTGVKYLHKEIRLNQHCVSRGAVRALFAPSRPGETTETTALAITSIALGDLRCEVRSYNRVLVADVDGDGQLEMYLDLTTAKEEVGEVRGPRGDGVTVKKYSSERRLYILGNDVSHVELSTSLGGHAATTDLPAEELIELRDVDHDGRLDVVQTELCFKPPQMSGDEGQLCDTEPRTRITYLYDAGKDMYRSMEGRELATRLHDRAMKSLAAGQPAAAAQIWREAAEADPTWSWPPYNLACVAAVSGQRDDAFAQLQLLADRSPDLDLLRRLDTDPDLVSLRELPAFRDAVSAVALAVLADHRYQRADGDASCSINMYTLGGDGHYTYVCRGCCWFSGTFAYAGGKLRLDIRSVEASGSASGGPRPLDAHATYRVSARAQQVCFTRVEASGVTADLPHDPLPDGCWTVQQGEAPH